MDVWKRTSDLRHWGNGTEHIETEVHKIRPHGKSPYDREKQGYTRRLQEPVLKQTHRQKNPNEAQPGQQIIL